MPVELVVSGLINSDRLDHESVSELASSIKSKGQLEPIAIRRYPANKDLFQVIYGHRRVEAIKTLGWKNIRAELYENIDDNALIQMALIENLQRKEMTDYEKGQLFKLLSDNFELTFQEIGRLIGKTKQYVSNHIAMANLFTSEEMKSDPEIVGLVKEITEAHARVLAKVADHSERARLLRTTVEGHFCTRELKSVVGRPREAHDPNYDSEVGWTADNIRNSSDNSEKLVTRHGKVCVFRTDSANFLISRLRISPHRAGEVIGKAAGKVLANQGLNPLDSRNWSNILIEKNKYAGWGKFSTTTDEKLVVHEPSLNPEFLRGYFEGLMGVKLKCIENKLRVQVFEILSSQPQISKTVVFRN